LKIKHLEVFKNQAQYHQGFETQAQYQVNFRKSSNSMLYQVLENQAQYNNVLAYFSPLQQAICSELGVRDD